jgi:alkylhydroperoxidase family enzyme
VTDQQIADLAVYRDSDAFDELQKRVLDYAVALTVTPDTATDEMVAGLRASLDEKQLVELTTMIAWENFRARFNRGFDVASQGFSEGASCPIPERRG